MGSLGYTVLWTRYRNVADRNLKAAYGDQMNEQERQALIKEGFSTLLHEQRWSSF